MKNRLSAVFDKVKSALAYQFKFRMFHFIPDSIYLRILYRLKMGKNLNLTKPTYFNEKLQWLKLYDKNPIYSTFADKYEVRNYIANKIGEKYLIPLIGVWDKFEDIDFNTLPDQFVLKCTHNSGGVYICRDKSKIDVEVLRKSFCRLLKSKYYYYCREWPYKNIKPRIICEKLILTKQGTIPIDYKFHCFNGVPDNVMVCTDRESKKTKFFYFNKEWKLLNLNKNGMNPPPSLSIPKPKKLDEMFEIAKILSKHSAYIRVDLYNEDDNIYFGELTLFPSAGFDKGLLEQTNLLFGEKIDLSKINQQYCDFSLEAVEVP